MVIAAGRGRPGEEVQVAQAAPGDGVLRRWHALCAATEGDDRHQWSEDEARALLAAVVAAVVCGDESALEPATRAWASDTASMPVLVRRLGCLRELLADDLLGDGPTSIEVLQPVLDKVTMLATETALAELEDAALTDALTGAGNRRALEAAARAALAGAARTGTPLSLAVIDLDGLKTLNDTEGHAAGDRALAGLATALRAALRETDQLFRVGGDEFVILLPLAPPQAVSLLMRRAEQLDAPSFSWGVSSAPGDATELADLLQIADSRLYAARRAAGYYEARRPTAPVAFRPAMPAAPATTAPARRRHHPWSLFTAAALSVAAVIGIAFALTASHQAPTAPPPTGPPLQGPPGPASGGPNATGGAGAGPTGSGALTPGGSSGTTGTAGTGTGTTGATGIGPTGSVTPPPGGGSTPPPPPPSSTTTAPSGAAQQPGVTLPPPLGVSGSNSGGLLG